MTQQKVVIRKNLLTQKEEAVPAHALSPAEKRQLRTTKPRRHSSQKKRLDTSHLRWV